ncbi:DUF3775 domain-containing protein [Roseibium aggregatum]|uniref:DUF3775 domain-containing protein n=1 Tax=Roseibium aggregatum TaxID=187304 RepID=A0A926NYB8_9HYPH|nr:DUF3775 domain-containing protein [Roseibium aggregatum]MBD1546345.1 DUF3775 domain-containing protein [Roseibium aggregatum]
MTQRSSQTEADQTELTIPLEKVCFIIFKAREFDAKDVSTTSDDGSNPSDDGDRSVLEDRDDDPVLQELMSLIASLSVDEQVDLVALMHLGRDDNTAQDWDDVRTEAAEAHTDRTAEYLCGTPLLADYLSDGLSALDYSCADYEMDHL